ncbi:MAG: hypothetical protein K8M05_30970, partial [Deltaproteobacteria bacterium]|nr:hypothetical protein [Kofleriaceae bacterium]
MRVAASRTRSSAAWRKRSSPRRRATSSSRGPPASRSSSPSGAMLEHVRSPSSPTWHALAAGEAVAAVQTDGERGLTSDEARARLAAFG